MTAGWRLIAAAGMLALSGASLPLPAQGSSRAQPGEGSLAARLAEIQSPLRGDWSSYLERSRRLATHDRAVMGAELARVGRDRMVRAPYARTAFDGGESQPVSWFASDTARRLADVILTYQTPSGGWSKRVAYDSARVPGQSWYSESEGWSYIATLDNGATTSHLWFLGRVDRAQQDPRYQKAFVRGVQYLLDAQYPNGCWPQVYPLQGSYHDAATFNDEAITNALRVLDAVAADSFRFVPDVTREQAAAAAQRGVECILEAQVHVGGRRTVWGQQHDALTLAPVGARSYEPRSLSGRESAAIMTYLMSLPRPDARVAEAIHAAAAHFESTAIHGYSYDYQQGLRREDGAGPIWARMLEIGTNRPIFSNRDGVVLYDWNQLTDRRTGYAWFGTEPGSALEKYGKWRRAHPEFTPRIPVRKG